MQAGTPRRRRARPVADAPLDALLGRAEELAKGWLLALLEDAPLEEAPAILAGDLPQDGPRICAAVVQALADDGDLGRLEPGGALEPLVAHTGRLVGARAPEEISRAIEALHAVIWSALREQLSYPDADLISALAERLALVTQQVREAALRGHADAADAERTPRRAGEQPPSELAARRLTAEPPQPQQFRAQDESRALWLSALEDEISRASRYGAPLALLLAELDDAERVLAAERDASATFGRFAQAVRSAVRRQDILACETDTRAWIIARDSARPGAQALGARIAEAVSDAGHWGGAPLRVSVGVAILGEDGQDSASLVAAAEEAMFAAAASGIGIIRATPASEPGDGAPRLVD